MSVIKKLLFILFLFCLASTLSFAEEGYVSPESYAINADETEYISFPVSNKKQTKNKKVKQKKQKEFQNEEYYADKEKGVKAWLRKKRYNAQESHHGQLHEIKLNSKIPSGTK